MDAGWPREDPHVDAAALVDPFSGRGTTMINDLAQFIQNISALDIKLVALLMIALGFMIVGLIVVGLGRYSRVQRMWLHCELRPARHAVCADALADAWQCQAISVKLPRRSIVLTTPSFAIYGPGETSNWRSNVCFGPN